MPKHQQGRGVMKMVVRLPVLNICWFWLIQNNEAACSNYGWRKKQGSNHNQVHCSIPEFLRRSSLTLTHFGYNSISAMGEFLQFP
jgi:hypothetical protein